MKSKIILQTGQPQDCRRLWEWRNDRETREASFNTEYIPFEEHESWFACKLKDSNTHILIASDINGKKVGYVRFDINGHDAEISTCIDKSERGKGYGVATIKKGSDHLIQNGSVQNVVAYIRPNNLVSLSAFRKAGFESQGYKHIEGVEARKMVYGR